MVGLWVPAVINLVGVRQMAWFQNVTVVLKFLPLLFVGVVGWFFVTAANFGPFNASGGSLYSGIGIAAGVALFSFIGVEAAAMTAKRVGTSPQRDAGLGIGTALSAVLYVLVTAGSWDWCPTTHWSTRAHHSSTPSSRFSLTGLGREVHRRDRRDLGHRGPQRLDP